MSACWPPTKWRMVWLMRCGAVSSKKADLPSFHSDMCIWPPQPGQSFDHLAMKVASQSRFCARILVNSRNSAARSADGSASPTRKAASSTPAPVSVCSPSMPMSMVSHMSSRSL